MIGFGSRSRPRLTVSGIAVLAGCGVAIAGEGTADSGCGMSGNWGGEEGVGVSVGCLNSDGRASTPCVYHDPGTSGTECSGFLGRPKVVAMFTGSGGMEDYRFLENIPILSSLRNMTPILSTEHSCTAGLTGKVDR